MSTLVIEIDRSTENSLRQFSEASGSAMQTIAAELLSQAVKTKPARSDKEKREAELLEKINRGFPAEGWERFHELTAKQRADTLTEAERAELLPLIEAREKANANRIGFLVQLAQLRGQSLDTVMNDLGLKAPCYV
jgi:hypothetical protein